jgi:hypothetical protein
VSDRFLEVEKSSCSNLLLSRDCQALGAWLVNIFREVARKTVDAYVDDIVLKSEQANSLIIDRRLAFDLHAEVKDIKLNPEKCVFGSVGVCCLDFSSLSAALKPNLKKPWPSQTWGQFTTSRGCNESRSASSPSTDSFRALANEGSPYTGC